MKFYIMILILFSHSFYSLQASAEVSSQSKIYHIKDGQVKFRAKALPGSLAIEGQGVKPVGQIVVLSAPSSAAAVAVKNTETNDKNELGAIEASLEGFTTGIDLRDRHLKEKYLQVPQYPKAILGLTTLNLETKTFSGDLNFHGEKKLVQGTFIKDKNKVTSVFTIKLSDFKVTPPKFMGVSVDDEVVVTVEMEMNEE